MSQKDEIQLVRAFHIVGHDFDGKGMAVICEWGNMDLSEIIGYVFMALVEEVQMKLQEKKANGP